MRQNVVLFVHTSRPCRPCRHGGSILSFCLTTMARRSQAFTQTFLWADNKERLLLLLLLSLPRRKWCSFTGLHHTRAVPKNVIDSGQKRSVTKVLRTGEIILPLVVHEHLEQQQNKKQWASEHCHVDYDCRRTVTFVVPICLRPLAQLALWPSLRTSHYCRMFWWS
jgi:hypothetical protein